MPLTTNVYPVRVEKAPERHVAFLRHIGPYTECGPTFQKLGMWAGPRGLIGPNTLMLGIGHDDPDKTPADKLRYDACITVSPTFVAEGEVGVQTIPGGDHAILTLKGPYERLGEAYRWLYGTWLPSSGREASAAPAYEVYLNTPMNAKPEDLLTEIYLLLKG